MNTISLDNSLFVLAGENKALSIIAKILEERGFRISLPRQQKDEPYIFSAHDVVGVEEAIPQITIFIDCKPKNIDWQGRDIRIIDLQDQQMSEPSPEMQLFELLAVPPAERRLYRIRIANARGGKVAMEEAGASASEIEYVLKLDSTTS